MSRSLDDLHADFKPLAQALLDGCVAAGIEVRIIDTLRTKEEQADFIAIGASTRMDSLHLYGLAIDIAPVSVLNLKNWAPNHADWARIGEIGESIGLRWGGRWKRFIDKPHFECPIEMEQRLTGRKPKVARSPKVPDTGVANV